MRPTPLAVMVCYKGGERQGWEKGKIRATYTRYSVAYIHAHTHLACPFRVTILVAFFLGSNRLIFLGLLQGLI